MTDTRDLRLNLGSNPQEEEEVLIYFDHSNRWGFQTCEGKNLSTDLIGYTIQNCLNESSDYTLNLQASPHRSEYLHCKACT